MLSRVADSLYWLSRYLERAENLARLVDVNRHDALEENPAYATAASGALQASGAGSATAHGGAVGHAHSSGGSTGAAQPSGHWQPLIHATGTEEAFSAARAEEGDELDAAGFITFSAHNPDSIRSCIAIARENARMVRDQISEEMWVELNRIHLFLQSRRAEQLWQRQPESLYHEVIKSSLLFQGLTDATIQHDEGWQFVRLGKFIERADKTSRILDVLTYLDNPERTELASVLRSCSGFAAFRAEFRGNITLRNVIYFLLLSSAFPRSVRFCLSRLDKTLHAISGAPVGTFSNEAERLTGSTLARLNFSNVDSIQAEGLHRYVDELQSRLNDIGQQLFETYVLLPSEIRNVSRSNSLIFQWQYQQQQQQQ